MRSTDFRDLSTHLANWILAAENAAVLAAAIIAGKKQYEDERQAEIDAVKGVDSKAPALPVPSVKEEPWADDIPSQVFQVASLLGSTMWFGAKAAVCATRAVAGMGVDAMRTDSAAELKRKFPVINSINAVRVFESLKSEPEHGGKGWEIEKHLDLAVTAVKTGRASMKTLILHEVVKASFKKLSSDAKDFFDADVIKIITAPLQARNFYFETIGAMKDIKEKNERALQPAPHR